MCSLVIRRYEQTDLGLLSRGNEINQLFVHFEHMFASYNLALASD